MLQIPEQVAVQLDTLLVQKEIPLRSHSECRKWLRYYLGFGRKYGFEGAKKSSFFIFVREGKG
jgi:hypothetical protein